MARESPAAQTTPRSKGSWLGNAAGGLLLAVAVLRSPPSRHEPDRPGDGNGDDDDDDVDRRGLPARVWAVTRATVRSTIDDRITGLAAEVAFFGVLALFPTLIAVAAVVGSLDAIIDQAAEDDIRRQILEWLREFLTEEASGVINAVETLFEQNSGSTFTIAFVAAALTASRGTNALMRALAIVHGRPDARSFLRRRFVAFLLILATVVAIAVLAAAFVVGPLLGRGEEIAEHLGLGSSFATFWEWFRGPSVFLAVVVWAAVVLHLAPDDDQKWRHDLPGAVLTAVLWLIATGGLRLYLAVAGETNQVFGILGGILIVLIWLHLLSASLLVGAELNAAIVAHRSGHRESTSTRRSSARSSRSGSPAATDMTRS